MPLGQKFRNKKLKEKFPRRLILPHSDRIAEKRRVVNGVAGTVKNYGIHLDEWIQHAIDQGWIKVSDPVIPPSTCNCPTAIAINYDNYVVPHNGNVTVNVATDAVPCDMGTTTYALSANPRYQGGATAGSVIFDGTSSFLVRPTMVGLWSFNYDILCDGVVIDVGTVSGVMSEDTVDYTIQVLFHDSTPVCPADFTLRYDLSPFGGLAGELFADSTALVNRMNLLNPVTNGWTYDAAMCRLETLQSEITANTTSAIALPPSSCLLYTSPSPRD